MKKIYIFILLLSLSFSSCEKDDICSADTPTTPKVVIEFYELLNPTAVKNVRKLKVIAAGKTEPFVFNKDFGTDNPDRFLFTGSKIKLPLNTLDDTTKFTFILNSGVATFENEDVVDFQYSRNTVFVSRACGYKTLFSIKTGFPKATDSAIPDGDWIKNIIISKTQILDENETHIKIYF